MVKTQKDTSVMYLLLADESQYAKNRTCSHPYQKQQTLEFDGTPSYVLCPILLIIQGKHIWSAMCKMCEIQGPSRRIQPRG